MIFEKQIQTMFRSQFNKRCDDTGAVFYYSAEDFPGLRKQPFAFSSSRGQRLQGYFYSYENPIPGRLIVFDHGFGGGHRSYMKEIELLCRHGYRVYSYDHTGCMESEGEGCVGLSQSLRDLNDCLCALKGEESCRSADISVMGHSWGGFSTLNIAAYHPQVSHIVVLSGFVSVAQMLKQFLGGPLALYRKGILEKERELNPGFADADAVKTLSATEAKVLLVYSDNDKLVKQSLHYDVLKAALSHKSNIAFHLESGKDHNPNYSHDAVKQLAVFSAAQAEKTKNKELESAEQRHKFKQSFDWASMTQQDEAVWSKIFQTLDA